MRPGVTCILSFVLVAGCQADSGETQSSPTSSRGGTLTVGGDSWTLVPSTQCSIYSDDLVNIAGHAAEDPSVEIVIDYGGPTGVTIGTVSQEPWWQAVQDSIAIEIENRRRVRGTATFEVFRNGTRGSVEGSFDITCQ
jgi:hypothetical protein